jgi:hypothetical protein
MRFFEGMNTSNNEVCPLCQTAEQGQILLAPILGTEEGNIVKCQQVHRRCADALLHAYLNALENEVR